MAENSGEIIESSSPKPDVTIGKEVAPKKGNHTPLDAENTEKLGRSWQRQDELRIDDIRSRLSTFIEEDKEKAGKIVKKKGKLITNPMARFNILNPDWQPSPDSGLELIPDPIVPEKLAKELKSPEKIADPETGQKFNVIKANWERLGQEPTLVFLPPYNNTIEKGATHYRIQELARQIGRSTLAIDHPQMGRSDKLTKVQRKALATEDGYGMIAETELRIMQKLGIKEIDLVSQSMGAWAAAAIAERAEKYRIKVRNLIVVDSPGIEEVKPGQLTKAEMKEGKYLDLYQSTPYDPEMRIASGQHLNPLRKKVGLVKWALSSLRNDPGGVYKKAMAKESLIGLLRRAFKKNPDLHVTDINGSLSRVSPKESNVRMVTELQSEFPDRVSQIIFPGEPHLVMESAKRFAATTKHVLTEASL